jgi:AraC-like DNA-binding protein
MLAVHRAPPPALAPFVESLWYYECNLPHARERILPSGSMQLLINLDEDQLRTYVGDGYSVVQSTRGAALGGVQPQHFAIDTAEQRAIAGVSFKPGGAYPFFAPPADELTGLHVELDVLWGRDGAVARERLLEARTPAGKLRTLEALLLGRVARPLERDPVVAFAVEAFARDVPVAEVTARLGMTPRRFIQRFGEAVGLTPKRFARLLRFQRVLAAVERGPVDWAEVALDCGYFDQAHLINDFRAFSGINPTAYHCNSTSGRNHMVLP